MIQKTLLFSYFIFLEDIILNLQLHFHFGDIKKDKYILYHAFFCFFRHIQHQQSLDLAVGFKMDYLKLLKFKDLI